VEIQLTKPSSTMWDEVLKAFREVLAKAEATYLSKAKSEPSQTALFNLH